MKQIVTDIIVLKRINFHEADRILTVLSRDGRRLTLLAKGVRKPKSRLAGGTELLGINSVTYIDGKSEIKTLISAQMKSSFLRIVTSVAATTVAFELIKTANQFSEHDASSELFEVLETALAVVNDESDAMGNVVFVWFVCRVLKIAGSGINLEAPIKADKFSDTLRYGFSFDDMAFYESANGVFTPKQIKYLRLCASSSSPLPLIRSVQGAEDIGDSLQPLCAQLVKIHRA